MRLELYREHLAMRIVCLIAEQNGGKLPRTAGDVERLFARFGASVEWVAREVLPTPMIRGHVVYVPDVRPGGRMLGAWLVHELAEVVLSWEGIREWQGPGWGSDRHIIANLVERRLCRRLSRGVSRRRV